MTLHEQSIAVYRSRLDTLAALLTTAEAHPKGDALLEAKLAEDMHPLATQVRFVANLPGEALPRLTERSFTSREENATTLAEAKAHIAETAELLDSIDPDELVATEDTIYRISPNGAISYLKIDGGRRSANGYFGWGRVRIDGTYKLPDRP